MSIVAAVLERLTGWAATQSSVISVYDTTIPGSPPSDPSGLGMYVVVYERTSLRSSGLDGVSHDAAGEVTVLSAAWLVNSGATAAEPCRWLVDHVQAQLVDWIPTVSGLDCGPLQQVGRPQPTPDETLTDRHLVYASDAFAYQAEKA